MAQKQYSINPVQTSFPMKANSQVREVEIQAWWESIKVYARNLEKRRNGEKFVLHDGPPYLSSAKIHIGTALNKILKDIVTRYKAMTGKYAPYVPGYDSHGLPIETAVLKDVKGGRQSMSVLELRKRCREFALANLKGQENNFKRLGVWGDWEKPYVTLDQKFEAAQLRVFGKMASEGYLYKGLKAITWCPNCETALADAEIEYHDITSDDIYVRFEVEPESKAKLAKLLNNRNTAKGSEAATGSCADEQRERSAAVSRAQWSADSRVEPSDSESEAALTNKISFVIWTTTTWTLPANVAIAVNAEFDYELLELQSGEWLIIADVLKDSFLEKTELTKDYKASGGKISGKELEFLKTKHPFFDRESVIILSDHVTADAGTGCVHTSPGHGPEDFELGVRYKLPIISPVEGNGVFNKEAGPFAGQRYDKAIPQILELLKTNGSLVHVGKFQHSYPHCWRCKKPLIFRATEQWFASVEGFRQKALKAIDEVTWLPASGRNRIYNMVEGRTDWCISRQRAWGVPIPVFYCRSCNHILMTSQSINHVADIFAQSGSDSWWEKETEFFLAPNTACEKCGSKDFRKETDTMDVWFDSGSTHAAVVDQREELKGTPCEMYLEGSDQHRGWFQSSLLTSVATKGRAPYKTVLTHGFVVDENGRKMSKSLGNIVEPETVISQYGADVLRLWVASVNYTDDIPIGKSMLAQLAEIYRKLRNTARYLLGNLYDYDPGKDQVAYKDLKDLDKFILHRLQKVIGDVRTDFDRYEFFKYYQVLQNFCVVDLSSFYFDIAKDRLYTAAPKSESRRAVQTVLAELLKVITPLLAPVAPHLAEDIWSHIPEAIKKSWHAEESVLLSEFPSPNVEFIDQEKEEFWSDLLNLRTIVNKALEQARSARSIGSSLEAQVHISIAQEVLAKKALAIAEQLPAFLITSQVKLLSNGEQNHSNGQTLSFIDEDDIQVAVLPANGKKCVRCWKYSTIVGTNIEHPELCEYCLVAIAS